MVLSGCEYPPDALSVFNETDITLTIFQQGTEVETR